MSCQTCGRLKGNVARAEGDLRAAARKAVKYPNARNIADIGRCKERVATSKEVLAQHERACEVLITVP